MQTNGTPQQFGYPLGSTKTVTAYKLNRSLVAMAFYLPRGAFDPRWSLWPAVVDIIANRWNEIETAFTQDIDALAEEVRANTDVLLYSPDALRNYYKFLDNLLLKPVAQFRQIDFWKDEVFQPSRTGQQVRNNSCPHYPDYSYPLYPDYSHPSYSNIVNTRFYPPIEDGLLREIGMLLLTEGRLDLLDSWHRIDLGDIVEDEAVLKPALIKFRRLCSGLLEEVTGIAGVIGNHFELAFPDVFDESMGMPVPANSKSKPVDNIRSSLSQEAESYDALVQIFTSEKDLLDYVGVLREYEKQTVDESLNWIGKKGSKAVLVAWIARLEAKGHIKPTGHPKNLIPLLTAYFNGLEIGVRTFYDQPKADTAKKLKDYFVAKIPH